MGTGDLSSDPHAFSLKISLTWPSPAFIIITRLLFHLFKRLFGLAVDNTTLGDTKTLLWAVWAVTEVGNKADSRRTGTFHYRLLKGESFTLRAMSAKSGEIFKSLQSQLENQQHEPCFWNVFVSSETFPNLTPNLLQGHCSPAFWKLCSVLE